MKEMMQELEVVNLQLDTENYRLRLQPDQPQTIALVREPFREATFQGPQAVGSG